jgi:hypothetical protein
MREILVDKLAAKQPVDRTSIIVGNALSQVLDTVPLKLALLGDRPRGTS